MTANRKPNTNPQKKTTQQPGKKPTQQQKKAASLDLSIVKDMSKGELVAFLSGAREILEESDYYAFAQKVIEEVSNNG